MRNPTGSKPLKSGIILAVACTIAFAYQNCGKVNFNSSPDKPFGKKSAAPGNGEGYEIRGPQDGEYLSYDLAFSPLNPDGIVAIRCEPTDPSDVQKIEIRQDPVSTDPPSPLALSPFADIEPLDGLGVAFFNVESSVEEFPNLSEMRMVTPSFILNLPNPFLSGNLNTDTFNADLQYFFSTYVRKDVTCEIDRIKFCSLYICPPSNSSTSTTTSTTTTTSTSTSTTTSTTSSTTSTSTTTTTSTSTSTTAPKTDGPSSPSPTTSTTSTTTSTSTTTTSRRISFPSLTTTTTSTTTTTLNPVCIPVGLAEGQSCCSNSQCIYGHCNSGTCEGPCTPGATPNSRGSCSIGNYCSNATLKCQPLF